VFVIGIALFPTVISMADMELKLVYRFLRQVSDWVLDGYYSEVVVEGEENVHIKGPLIMYVDLPFSFRRSN
jgi:hypothetical protein